MKKKYIFRISKLIRWELEYLINIDNALKEEGWIRDGEEVFFKDENNYFVKGFEGFFPLVTFRSCEKVGDKHYFRLSLHIKEVLRDITEKLDLNMYKEMDGKEMSEEQIECFFQDRLGRASQVKAPKEWFEIIEEEEEDA